MTRRTLATEGLVQNAFSSALVLAALVLGSLPVDVSNAQLADKQTRNLLIQKLTQVYATLAPADPARTALTTRLADLHAERARQEAMAELQAGCTVCNAGAEDRKKALRYYQEVLPKLNDSQVAKVLPQVGHLYQMTGQEKLAIETYQKVIADGKQPEALAEAHLSLAELGFKKREFQTAKNHYEKVLSIPQSSSKGLAAYRSAWCDFNLGKLDDSIAGLKKVLMTPELSSRTATGGVVQVDKQFQEEVSRDLATFLARRPVTPEDAKMLFDLSPETVKLPNITYLAGETERLGQGKSAVALWRFAQDRQTKPRLKVEGHIRIAQLEMEQKNPRAAGQEFDLAMNLWGGAIGTSEDDQAKEMKARLRKLVLDWNRAEKKSPSDELAAAYKAYLATFPQEADMTVWSAQVSRDRKEYADAVKLYSVGANLYSILNSKLTATSAAPNEKPDFRKAAVEGLENALLGAIETAEISKDTVLLGSAYDAYLALSLDKKREVEVFYQKANLTYQKQDYALAADQMRTIAFMTGAKSPDALKIRMQAADLALDALVILKDDEKIEKWAKDFAGLFPMAAPEYAKVARKSVLTQSAALASAGAGEASGAKADYEKAWTVLSRFDLATTTPEDKIAFLKNRLILAEQTKRFSEARDAADQMLKLAGTSAEDRQYALSRKAWLAELILDFDTALSATEQILPTKDVPEDQRLLKLAMYAELANKDTRPYLSKYLGVSKDEDKQLTIASQLVRESKDPLKELEKQKTVLLKSPQLYAQLALEIAAKLEKVEVAKMALSQKGVVGTSAGRLLSRMIILDEVSAQKAKFSAHVVDGSTQKKLASTLKARIAMIEALEKTAGKAVESGDWTTQLVSLDFLAKESERFYSEILSLPMPAGLSPEDEQQYLGLLSQQAAPYQIKAQDVKKKVDEFWSNKSAVQALETSLVSSAGPLRSVVVKEIKLLASVAPETSKAELEALASRPEANAAIKPNLAQIEQARQAVREEPLSTARLETLLGLERQAGRIGMVSYLEGRIQNVGATAPTNTGGSK